MRRLFSACLSLCCFMVLPVAAQTFQASTMGTEGLINQLTSYDAGDKPVSVTGQVRQVGGDQAVGVTIRFWQPATPFNFVTTETDQQGRYDIELGPGLWSGEACGSAAYLPAAWQVLIDGDRIKRLESIQQKNIHIDSISIDGVLGDEFNRHDDVTLTLRGQGFGCSGSVEVVFLQGIDFCGDELPLDYGRAVIKVNEFDQRTDTLLRFQPPSLGDGDVQQNRVSLFYQQAGQRSNALALTEYVLTDQHDDNAMLCEEADPTVGNETSTGASAELIDDVGTVNSDTLNDNPIVNGAFGGAVDNPANEGAGGGTPQNFDGTLDLDVDLELDNLNIEGIESFEGIDAEGLNR